MIEHLCKKRPPAPAARRRFAAVFEPRLFDVALAAEGLQAINIPGVLARLALQRRNVIAFELAGLPTRATPVSIAGENGAPDVLPATGFNKAGVLAAHYQAADRYRHARGGRPA